MEFLKKIKDTAEKTVETGNSSWKEMCRKEGQN